METQIILNLHITGKARLDYGTQQITEFTYWSVRRGLVKFDFVKGTTTNCDCSFNDDIEVGITNLWPTGFLFSTTAEQVDPDATFTHC